MNPCSCQNWILASFNLNTRKENMLINTLCEGHYRTLEEDFLELVGRLQREGKPDAQIEK